MKTNEQIAKYAAQCCFSDEDWQRVLSYCKNHFRGCRLHRAQRPLSDSNFDQFLSWIDKGFGVGDIVRYGHTIGIVGAYTPDYVCLAAYLSFDRTLINQRMIVPGYKLIQSIESDRAEIQKLMEAADLKFSVSLACLAPAYAPNNGDIVRVITNGIHTTGIFKAKKTQEWSFYALVKGGEILRDCTLPTCSISVSLPTKTDIERLQVVLAHNQMEWAARQKELRSVPNARADKGGRYWYLSEKLSVVSDVDRYTKKHDERHKNGNYFCSYSTAILFSQKIKNIRKELAGTNHAIPANPTI